MGNTDIRQHKEVAMGHSADVGGDCSSAFMGKSGEHMRGKAMKDGQRAMKKSGKDVDHGPHDMDGDSY